MRVAGKDPGSRRPPARRATLPATGHAATRAPTSAARTASGESEASHHRQATEDSIARAHSLGLSGGSDPDPASFSHQAPATRASLQPGPFQDFYQRSLAKGIKPTMVRLTLARKIAAITLTLWKKGENFDAEKLKSQAA